MPVGQLVQLGFPPASQPWPKPLPASLTPSAHAPTLLDVGVLRMQIEATWLPLAVKQLALASDDAQADRSLGELDSIVPEARSSSGQLAATPSQTSATSHTPTAARQTVPAAATESPSQHAPSGHPVGGVPPGRPGRSPSSSQLSPSQLSSMHSPAEQV